MPRKETPLLSEALDEYMTIRATHLARTSLANDRSQLRCFVRGMGDCRTGALTPQKVEAFFVAEAARQQPASYNKVRQRVKLFIDFLLERRYVSRNPMVMVTKRPVIKRERLRLSPDELLELPSFANSERDKAILVLACNTALRADEIRNLRVKDLDLAGGWLHVVIGKSYREDLMPVTQECGEALREWLTAYERVTRKALQPDWYLFPSRVRGNGSGPYFVDPEAPIHKMSAVVQKAMIAAGHTIGKGEGVHTLRRSVARVFFDRACVAGHDAALRMTSSLLHHSSTQVTEGYLGLQHERLSRDDILRGKRFLTAAATGRVSPLTAVS